MAATATPGRAAEVAPSDPLEPFNRAMFAFNRAVVTNIVNPVVGALSPITPQPVKTGLANAYTNLTEVEQILNGLLRANLRDTGASAGRFVVNSTLGVAGLFDVATPLGLARRETNFGTSLCDTGIMPGPYLVLPLVGPSNAVAAPALVAGVALEVYALSFISTTLAMADFIVIDIGGSASALRNMNDLPAGPDGYDVQRGEYLTYIHGGCRTQAALPVNDPVPNATSPKPPAGGAATLVPTAWEDDDHAIVPALGR